FLSLVSPVVDPDSLESQCCSMLEEQCCDFVLHEWCTRLPAELPCYPDHPQHTLVFVSKVPDKLYGIFYCQNCKLYCNGFAYGCTVCDYYIDVNCGFIPEEITHEAHPDHILSRCDRESMRKPCVTEGTYYGIGQAPHEVDLRSGREP
nr:zinc finger, PHD-type [Tanacetum cinerariifolium]